MYEYTPIQVHHIYDTAAVCYTPKNTYNAKKKDLTSHFGLCVSQVAPTLSIPFRLSFCTASRRHDTQQSVNVEYPLNILQTHIRVEPKAHELNHAWTHTTYHTVRLHF